MYTPFDFTLCPDSHLRCGFTLRTMEVTMQVNGIIAEYNPFHNGHKYQMEEARRRTSASYTVIAMSGNFVQRGAPALVDKHSRAEMALRCGADLVLELPTLYAWNFRSVMPAPARNILRPVPSPCSTGWALSPTCALAANAGMSPSCHGLRKFLPMSPRSIPPP